MPSPSPSLSRPASPVDESPGSPSPSTLDTASSQPVPRFPSVVISSSDDSQESPPATDFPAESSPLVTPDSWPREWPAPPSGSSSRLSSRPSSRPSSSSSLTHQSSRPSSHPSSRSSSNFRGRSPPPAVLLPPFPTSKDPISAVAVDPSSSPVLPRSGSLDLPSSRFSLRSGSRSASRLSLRASSIFRGRSKSPSTTAPPSPIVVAADGGVLPDFPDGEFPDLPSSGLSSRSMSLRSVSHSLSRFSLRSFSRSLSRSSSSLRRRSQSPPIQFPTPATSETLAAAAPISVALDPPPVFPSSELPDPPSVPHSPSRSSSRSSGRSSCGSRQRSRSPPLTVPSSPTSQALAAVDAISIALDRLLCDNVPTPTLSGTEEFVASVPPISEPLTPSSCSFPTTLPPVTPLSAGDDGVFAPSETPGEVGISETQDISQEDQPVSTLQTTAEVTADFVAQDLSAVVPRSEPPDQLIRSSVEAEWLLEVDSEDGEVDTKGERAANENAKKNAKANWRRAAKQNAKRAAEKNAERAAKENAKRAPQKKSGKNAKKNAKRAAKRRAERKEKRDAKGDAPLSSLFPPESPGEAEDSKDFGDSADSSDSSDSTDISDISDSSDPPAQTPPAAVEESTAPVFPRRKWSSLARLFAERPTSNIRQRSQFPSTTVPPSPPPPPSSELPSRTPVAAIPEPPPPPPTSKYPQFVDPNYRPLKQKVSAAEQEWQRRKDANEEGSKNEAIDKLMRLVGLEEVKEQVLAISAKVEICKVQETDLEDERFHIVFQGNPGTGKTTVARIYAEFLKTSGVLKSATVTERTGAKLAYGGPELAQEMIDKIIKAGGGVLFVDEAYQLTAPHATIGGRQVLDIILTEMENNIGKLVVIFVGYNDEMQSFFEHNPGLASRIPYTLQFADFEDVELWNILRGIIKKKYGDKMVVEGGMEGLFMRIAIRRLAGGRGVRNFGNARAVHNLLARILERQAKRLVDQRKNGTHKGPTTNQDYFFFAKEDMIGPDPSMAVFKSKAWAKLQTLIGLDEVKASANSMIDMIVTNYQRELVERKPLNFSLNRVFYGSPGTGKTTVAKLYGQILADIGLLSNGEVIIKNPSDFIGQCLGKSEAKTRAILAMSIGKVLIIDEAYMLNTGGAGGQDDKYKTAVVDTLVAEVQSVPGEDRCILILGYEDKLKAMFHNVNPGLSRRFAIEDPFRFQDFDVPQLERILMLKMKGEDLTAKPEALSVALDVLGRAQMRPNFSNGGEVDIFLARAKLNYQTRQSKKPPLDRAYDCVFEPEDFDPDYRRDSKVNCRQLLQGQVSEDIIGALESYMRIAAEAKEDGLDPRKEIPTKIVFKGPPGTGKTITANKMGKVYYDMGFLSTSEVIECSASDLIGQFVGQTGPKTKEQLDRALGKVLFVDEAYRLAEGQYALEAVNELIYLLATPRYDGKIVVILAGYTQDMNRLMTARPALSGLFPDEINFYNLTPSDCLTLLGRELKLKRTSASILEKTSSKTYRQLLRLMNSLSLLPSWSNARDIKTLAKKMSASATRGKTPTGEPMRTLSSEQVLACASDMWKMRFERSGQQAVGVRYPTMLPKTGPAAKERLELGHAAAVHCEPPACGPCTESSDPSTDNIQEGEHAQNTPSVFPKTIAPPPLAICRRPQGCVGNTRGPGVSDIIWDQLQEDRRNQESYKKKRGQEERRKDEEAQERLQKIGACSVGYTWIKQTGGYRCSAGVCFISDEQLAQE